MTCMFNHVIGISSLSYACFHIHVCTIVYVCQHMHHVNKSLTNIVLKWYVGSVGGGGGGGGMHM